MMGWHSSDFFHSRRFFLGSFSLSLSLSLLFHRHRLLELQQPHRHYFLCSPIQAILAGEDKAMDFDFRPSAVYSAKHLSAVQPSRFHSDHYSMFYDSDGDDDSRSYFPCPFCYVEIEVPVLCNHLQEEHCFDLKNAVCPLCAANLGKDAIGHFIVQHSSSLKRRWKSEKSNIWSNSTMLRKKLAANTRGNKPESAPDLLLSPFIWNISVPNPKNVHQDEHPNNNAPVISDAKSGGRKAHVGDEQDQEERRQRAAFVQELVASTIF